MVNENNIDFSRSSSEVINKESDIKVGMKNYNEFENDDMEVIKKRMYESKLLLPKEWLSDNNKFGLHNQQIDILSKMSLLEQAIYLTLHYVLKLNEVKQEVSKLLTINAVDNNTDVMNIVNSLTPENLEDYMKFDQSGEDNAELANKINTLNNLIKNYTIHNYVKHKEQFFQFYPNEPYLKNKDFADYHESTVIEIMVNRYFNSSSSVGKALDNVSRMPALDYQFKEMNLDTRKRLEILKLGLINDLGYTEESVHKYLEARFKQIAERFDAGVYESRDQAYYDQTGIDELKKQYLVKDPKWVEHFQKTGERLKLYKSDMLDAIIEHDVKPLELMKAEFGDAHIKKDGYQLVMDLEATKQNVHKFGLDRIEEATGGHIRTIRERSALPNGVTESYAERKKRERQEKRKAKEETNEDTRYTEQKSVFDNVSINDLKKFKSELATEFTKEVVNKAIELEKEEVKVEVPKVEEKIEIEENKPSGIDPYTIHTPEEDEINLELELLNLKMKELELKKKQAELKRGAVNYNLPTAKPDTFEEKVEVKNEVKETTIEPVVELVDSKPSEVIIPEVNNKTIEVKEDIAELMSDEYFKDRGKNINLNNGIDAYASNPAFKIDADTSILRNIHDPIKRVKMYKESEKIGRTMFLPVSGYEVKVCKLANKDQLGILFNLLKQDELNGSSIDQLITDECLSILYSCIEFPFSQPVSRTDFLKCLHPNDMILLMIMMGIVNTAPNKDGKVELEISNVICSSDVHVPKQVYNLKKPLVIDILQEFQTMYKVTDTLLNRRSKYVAAEYKTIFDAFMDNGAGISEHCIIEGDMLDYQITITPVTMYKQTQQREELQKVVYDTIKSDMKMEGTQNALFRAKLGRDYNRVNEYLNNSTYDDYVSDSFELDGLQLIDFSNTYSNIPDKNQRDQLLQDQEDKKERFLSIKRIYELVAEYVEDLAEILVVMEFIEFIKVYTKDGELITGPVTHQDYPSLLQLFTQIPDIQPILDAIDKLDSRMERFVETYRINFTSKELAGRLPKFEEMFLSDIELKNKLQMEDIPEKQIEIMMQEHNERRQLMHSGKCHCGSTMFHLDWRSIIFHSLSKTFPAMIQ